jgi:hypothetical protein
VVTGHGSHLVVTDGDGGRDEATAQRVPTPVNAPATADDATATVMAGESVDLDLPARDPEGEPIAFEIVRRPDHGTVALRAQTGDPLAEDVTYAADPQAGTDSFSYRVKDSAGISREATVTVTVTARTDVPPPAVISADAPPIAQPTRVAHAGAKPVAPRAVENATTADTFTLPSTKACVSRRRFSIRVKPGDYTSVVVWVNGKRVKALTGKRITASVDLRGLPRGTFKVKIAATLKSGKVVKDTRSYRTCTSKKGAKR